MPHAMFSKENRERLYRYAVTKFHQTSGQAVDAVKQAIEAIYQDAIKGVTRADVSRAEAVYAELEHPDHKMPSRSGPNGESCSVLARWSTFLWSVSLPADLRNCEANQFAAFSVRCMEVVA